MILIICIGVYIIIGVLLSFFHPEIPEINLILRRIVRPTINDYIDEGSYTPRWKRVLAVIIIRSVTIVIGPAVSLIDLIINTINEIKKEEDYDYLYFVLMNGAGEVSCVDCGNKTILSGYVDGGPGSDWNQKGYQCQSCGRFHEIEYADRLDQLPRCDCGGELFRNKWLFCPECRSDHLIYNEQYVSEEQNKPDIYKSLLFHSYTAG